MSLSNQSETWYNGCIKTEGFHVPFEKVEIIMAFSNIETLRVMSNTV